MLLPRRIPPDPVPDDEIARIRERLLLYGDARDLRAITSLAPQLARDVRSLVDHLDALAHVFGKAVDPARADLTAQDLTDILYRLCRYETQKPKEGVLELALSNDVEPLMRLVDATVGDMRVPADPNATIPPHGWTLHVEEDIEAPRGSDERRFEVSIGHESFGIVIRALDERQPPWSISVLLGDQAVASQRGDDFVEVLRSALDFFLYCPLGLRYRKAGFEATAIAIEFKSLGSWLTPGEQRRVREARQRKWDALAERLRPGLERLLREHGVDAKDAKLQIGSDAPAWVSNPRLAMTVTFDDPGDVD